MVYVEVVSNLIGCYQIKKDMADDMEGEYYLRVVLKKITLLKLESKGFEFYLKKQQKKAVRQLSERKSLVARRATRGQEVAPRNNFWVFYLIELRLCTMIELFIPKNRMIFVFRF